MITIKEDGEAVAEVRLIGGQMQVKYLKPVQDIIETMKDFRGRTLTDSEAYHAMPFRLTGRTYAAVSGPDADRLRDPSTFKAIVARADREYETPSSDPRDSE